MEEIVRVHYPDIESKLLANAMEAFYWIRNMKDIQKKPSTSELLDWLQALVLSGVSVDRIKTEIPYVGVLLKKNQDLETLFDVKNRKNNNNSGYRWR